MRLFPRWAEHLDLDAEIVGFDLPIGAPGAAYRDCITQLAQDERIAGALVTTHKAAVHDHASDLFAWLDPHARLCREVSCIARREDGLAGWAKDPITAGQSLDHLLGPDYWNGRDAHAVCFGAGGAGLAIAVCLLTQPAGPASVALVDRDPARLDLARRVYAELNIGTPLACWLHDDPADNDALVAASPAGSLIVNATGMGKDRPGAPITSAARFPVEAVAWDLNYRGELEFLELARAQADRAGVRAEDGWRYFLHGWTEVIAEVFSVDMDAERFDALAEIASRMSGRAHRPSDNTAAGDAR